MTKERPDHAAALERDWERARRNSAKKNPKAPLEQSEWRRVGGKGKREKIIATHEDGSVEEQWLAVPADEERCTATVRSGPYKGNRCRIKALRGARVCASHGGSLPGVKKAAQMRLLAATDLVSSTLVDIALDSNEETADRLRAITAILDRAGIDGKQTVTIEVKPWQEALSALSAKVSSGKKTKRAKVIDGSATEA